jgi:YfiH family protein
VLDRWAFKTKGSLKLYQDMLLTETGLVKQGFSTRMGGISLDSYSSFNLAFHVGDVDERVNYNRVIFSNSLGINKDDWVTLNQVHSDKVIVISQDDKGKGASSLATVIGEGDAMITNDKGIPLATFYADCISLFIVDEKNRAIGLAHAGWKGTLQEIGVKTLAAMNTKFGTKPDACTIAIGPGIDQCCYEVDQEISRLFCEKFDFGKKILKTSKLSDRWMLDLKLANWLQFSKLGVRDENISVSSLCTKCYQHLFYSFRGAGGKTGRMAALLMLV